MGASVTTGLQMAAAARPSIPACQRLLGSRAALPSFARALSTQTGFASCRKTASAGPFVSLNHKRFAVRAMSAQGLPIDLRANKRYAGSSNWTVKEVAETVKNDFGTIDILVHSLANGPEVKNSLLETSRKGYLAAVSASSYSFISLLQHFLPIMNPGGATISLTYIASERTIPGYGGGMSSAKAALESDTRVLAYEAGRKGKIRVNTISAGPLGSRAAKAIGFIEKMIEYSYVNAPLQKELLADEVGNTAAFLASPLASAITGSTIYVDNGLNTMGLALDSPTLST
uniref:Uncharacterized protein n=1 Tax=Oryza meridionalis TaxID=40149 RepID=A0A0E0EQ51_9ORYZ